MGQIKYALMDIKRSPGRYLLFAAEIVISFLLITTAVISLFTMAETSRFYKETLSGRSMYMLKDLTTADKLRDMRRSEHITDRMAEFYDFLSEEHKDFTVARLDEAIEPGSMIARSNAALENKHRIKVLMVSPSFFEYYNVSLSEGALFDGKAYSDTESQLMPAILGSEYRMLFKLGDRIDTLDNSYKVIGFMEEDSVYYRLEKSPDLFSLDNAVIVPLNIPRYRADGDFLRLHLAITGTYIETDNAAEMSEIIAKSHELGLYDLAYQSFKDQMDYILGNYNLRLQLLVFLIVIILTFSMIGMTANIMLFIRSSLKEFSIHMLCGAKKNTIIFRIAIPFAAIWLLGILISGFYLKHAAATLIAALIMAVILTIILLVSLRDLKKDNIERLLRRVE